MRRYWRWQRHAPQAVATLTATEEASDSLAHFAAYLVEERYAGGTVAAYVQSVITYTAVFDNVEVPRCRLLRMALVAAKRVTPAPQAKHPISGEQLQWVLQPLDVTVSDELCLRAALCFAFCTGSRVSNYAACGEGKDHPLRWRDVSFDTESTPPAVRVLRRSSKTKQGTSHKPQPLWMGAAPRTPTLCPVTLLRAWHAHRRDRRRTRPHDRVFVRDDGSRLRNTDVNDFLASRAGAAGVPALTSHCFRVSFMTTGSLVGASRRLLYRQADFADPTSNAVASEAYVQDFRHRMVQVTQRQLLTTASQLSEGQPAAQHRRHRRRR